jgi:hypothetical protein
MTPLVGLITSSVTPGAWKVLDSHGGFVDNSDGSRSISPYARDLTLIIRQTAEGHEQVAERLEQLRGVLAVREGHSPDEARENATASLPFVPPPPAGARPGSLGMTMRAMMGGSPGTPVPTTVVYVPAGADVRSVAAVSPAPGEAANVAVKPSSGESKAGAPQLITTYRAPTTTSADVAPGKPAAPKAPAHVVYAVSADGKHNVSLVPANVHEAGDTERRLRSLEEKLDRVLKALDVPKGDRTGDALPK